MVKILYVEDDEGNRSMLSERLKRLGYDVVAAADGLEAMELAQAQLPSVIVMDLDLPGIDGWEATRRLKAQAATRAIPVIALSAHAMPGDREIAIAAGCDEYEVKPVDLQRLRRKICDCLGGGSENA